MNEISILLKIYKDPDYIYNHLNHVERGFEMQNPFKRHQKDVQMKRKEAIQNILKSSHILDKFKELIIFDIYF